MSPSWTTTFKPNNPDSWKPPDAWDCGPVDAPAPSIHEVIEEPDKTEDDALAMDLQGMQREMRRMAAASDEIVLQRLREVWGTSTDAALYKELEMEKKRWMLSALHHMDTPSIDTSRPSPGKVASGNVQKILALYESQCKYKPRAVQRHG
jgi:hypothetical protein